MSGEDVLCQTWDLSPDSRRSFKYRHDPSTTTPSHIIVIIITPKCHTYIIIIVNVSSVMLMAHYVIININITGCW